MDTPDVLVLVGPRKLTARALAALRRAFPAGRTGSVGREEEWWAHVRAIVAGARPPTALVGAGRDGQRWMGRAAHVATLLAPGVSLFLVGGRRRLAGDWRRAGGVVVPSWRALARRASSRGVRSGCAPIAGGLSLLLSPLRDSRSSVAAGLCEWDPRSRRRRLIAANAAWTAASGRHAEVLEQESNLDNLAVPCSVNGVPRGAGLGAEQCSSPLTHGLLTWHRPDGVLNLHSWTALSWAFGGRRYIVSMEYDATPAAGRPDDSAGLAMLFRRLVETAQDGIVIAEECPRTRIPHVMYCNDRYVEMSGRTREELQSAEDLEALRCDSGRIPDEDVLEYYSEPFMRHQYATAEYWESYRARLGAGQPVTGIGSWRRPDGRKNLYEWSAVRAAVGDRVYQFGIDRDITEHIALLRGMRDALLRFQRSEGEAGQYVRAISEDLGRPVGELVRELRSLAGAEGGGGSAAAPLGRVLEHAEHLNDLLGGLTAYAEAGGAPVPARPVPAADCLGEAVRSLAGAIAATGASVIYDALPELPVPRLELVTVFENLLDNAIKFRDGRPPVIEIGHRHQSDGYLFWVRDNGRGFRAGDSMQAFRLFERLHDPDRYPGKGLGLALCRKIVESRGGRVWAESEPGQGATIFFTLPGTAEGEPHRAEIEELAQQMRAHPYRAYDLAEHSRRMHISHGYFRQLFRRYAHRSPYAYLITWRMRQAARDLRDPHRPVKSIALAAGYTDPAQFSKTFRKQIGASPSEFRHRLGL